MDSAEVIGVEIKATLRLYDKDTGLALEGDTAQQLCRLEKNQEKNISVYVYLEGARASQSFATANDGQNLSGAMNLQFSSSADLKSAYLGELVSEESD